MVPTRTLIQIRTHAQKYFTKTFSYVDGSSQLTTSDEALAEALAANRASRLGMLRGGQAAAFGE